MLLAKQMGHADLTMIARTCGKWKPDADRLAESRAESVFGIEIRNRPTVVKKLQR